MPIKVRTRISCNNGMTPLRQVDFSVAGGPIGSYRELAKWMRGDGVQPGRMSAFSNWQHMLSLPLVTVAGNTAKARTDFLATHRGRADQGNNVHYNAAGNGIAISMDGKGGLAGQRLR